MVRFPLAHDHPRVSSMTSIAELLDGVEAILFDFDGPVCSVFAGYPAPEVARELRTYLASRGIDTIAPRTDMSDPLEVLRWTATACPNMAPELDDVMRAAEQKAAESATPTPYAHVAILAAKSTGHAVAIVSNNSEPAIRNYLDLHRLTPHVTYIAGRERGKPELMKPHPDCMKRTIRHLAVAANSCALIGDSATDIQVSHLTGVRPVGYAETPARRADLADAGAKVVINSMRELVTALNAARNSRPSNEK
jgi:phosphoglycolate phosphatase-like HAD superfamily hydrolase